MTTGVRYDSGARSHQRGGGEGRGHVFRLVQPTAITRQVMPWQAARSTSGESVKWLPSAHGVQTVVFGNVSWLVSGGG